MNQNNNQPQMLPNQQQGQGQVPDHRMREMEAKLQKLELQNTQLRTTVDFLKQGPNQGPKPPGPESKFNPEVAAAINAVVEQKLAPMDQQYRQQIGWMADQLDQAKFKLNYGGEKFAQYHDRVEQVHAQEIAAGRYVSREDILKMVHFEETGVKQVKPDPAQVPQAQPPKFDPFFNSYVDENGNPVQGQPVQGDEQAPQMPNQQMPQQPQWQQQAPQNQQFQQQPQQGQYGYQQPGVRPPQGTQHPHGNAYGQQFNLPNQGVNTPAAQQQFNPRAPLNLETMTEADLEAFEGKFGDIPL